MDLAPGTLVLDRYVVERMLAEGGMGCVYEARHRELGARVALKVLKRDAAVDAEVVARFRREAQIAGGLESPHVARVLDVGSLSDDAPVMVMELLEGNDLGVELERRGPLPPDEAVRWVLEATEGMIDAHRAGIVHRDLKPGNLFLARAAGGRAVKILDFGISRIEAPGVSRMTQTQSAFGTPLYMSPEQIRSAKLADERSDVWSMGVILYELCTGVPPFVAETATALAVAINVEKPKAMAELRPGVIDARLDAIVARCLEKDPAARMPSMDDLASALRAWAGASPAERGPESRRADAPRAGSVSAAQTLSVAQTIRLEPQRRGGRRALVVVASSSLVATVAVVVLVGWLRADPQAAGGSPGPRATEDRAEPEPPAKQERLAEPAPPTPQVAPSESPAPAESAERAVTSAAPPASGAPSATVRAASPATQAGTPRASASPRATPSAAPTPTSAPAGPAPKPSENPLHL